MSWALDYILDHGTKRKIQAADTLGLTVTYDYAKANNIVTVTITFKAGQTILGTIDIPINYTSLHDNVSGQVVALAAEYQKWNTLKTQLEAL